MNTSKMIMKDPLIPPFRFAAVEEDLFRGAYPTLKNFRFLKRLQLRTILSLVPEKPTGDLEELCAALDVKLTHIEVNKSADSVTLTHEQAVTCLKAICDASNLPLYVHCLDGANTTGLVVMALRKLQNVNAEEAIAEFVRHSRNNEFSHDEDRFLAKFRDFELDSVDLPPWLWALSHPPPSRRFTPQRPRTRQPPPPQTLRRVACGFPFGGGLSRG